MRNERLTAHYTLEMKIYSIEPHAFILLAGVALILLGKKRVRA